MGSENPFPLLLKLTLCLLYGNKHFFPLLQSESLIFQRLQANLLFTSERDTISICIKAVCHSNTFQKIAFEKIVSFFHDVQKHVMHMQNCLPTVYEWKCWQFTIFKLIRKWQISLWLKLSPAVYMISHFFNWSINMFKLHALLIWCPWNSLF